MSQQKRRRFLSQQYLRLQFSGTSHGLWVALSYFAARCMNDRFPCHAAARNFAPLRKLPCCALAARKSSLQNGLRAATRRHRNTHLGSCSRQSVASLFSARHIPAERYEQLASTRPRDDIFKRSAAAALSSELRSRLQAKNKVNILNSFSFCPFLKSFKGIGNYLLNLLDLNIGKLVVGMLFPTLA